MKAIYITRESVEHIDEPIAMAIGYFDGLHKGHQVLVNEVLDYSKKHNMKSAVLTFSPNPAYILGKTDEDTLITPIAFKENLLEDIGVDYLFVVEFSERVLSMDPEEFVEEFITVLNVKHLVFGSDWRYGHKGLGNSETIKQYHNLFSTKSVELLKHNGEKISSSSIRELIKDGSMESVSDLLTRDYCIKGEVIHGMQRGRTIGFPTANVLVEHEYVMPALGVYIGEVNVYGKWYRAMINIGFNPTFNLRNKMSIEAHILDFDQDIYGENIRVCLKKKIREEKKFSSIDELVNQLNQDLDDTKAYFKEYPEIQSIK
jgi:riboflavin kinase/FMN adenylyltransferase